MSHHTWITEALNSGGRVVIHSSAPNLYRARMEWPQNLTLSSVQCQTVNEALVSLESVLAEDCANAMLESELYDHQRTNPSAYPSNDAKTGQTIRR